MTAPTLEAERAALAAFPLSDSPHTSVKMRADADRAAYKAGYLAARRTAAPVAEAVALPPKQSIDTPDFRALLDIYRDADNSQSKSARAALIAYLDGRTAAAPSPLHPKEEAK